MLPGKSRASSCPSTMVYTPESGLPGIQGLAPVPLLGYTHQSQVTWHTRARSCPSTRVYTPESGLPGIQELAPVPL